MRFDRASLPVHEPTAARSISLSFCAYSSGLHHSGKPANVDEKKYRTTEQQRRSDRRKVVANEGLEIGQARTFVGGDDETGLDAEVSPIDRGTIRIRGVSAS